MITLMFWVVLAACWLIVLPLAAIVLGRVLAFGERPSTPWQADGVDASGAKLDVASTTAPAVIAPQAVHAG